MPLLEPTTANMRAEKARYRLSLSDMSDLTGMQPTLVSMFLNDYRPLKPSIQRTLAKAINVLIGKEIFLEE